MGPPETFAFDETLGKGPYEISSSKSEGPFSLPFRQVPPPQRWFVLILELAWVALGSLGGLEARMLHID